MFRCLKTALLRDLLSKGSEIIHLTKGTNSRYNSQELKTINALCTIEHSKSRTQTEKRESLDKLIRFTLKMQFMRMTSTKVKPTEILKAKKQQANTAKNN